MALNTPKPVLTNSATAATTKMTVKTRDFLRLCLFNFSNMEFLLFNFTHKAIISYCFTKEKHPAFAHGGTQRGPAVPPQAEKNRAGAERRPAKAVLFLNGAVSAAAQAVCSAARRRSRRRLRA